MSNPASFEYSALEVQQKPDSDAFYLIKANAGEILKWADVPRKKAAFMAGYQRELEDRHTKIRDFLTDDPKNVIPGAIIVSLKPGSYSIGKHGKDGSCVVTITFTEKSEKDLLREIYEAFLARLSDSERASIEKADPATEWTPPSDDDDPEDVSPPESYLAKLTSELRLASDDFSALSADRQKAVREYIVGVHKPGLILDGQHRVFGAKNVSDFDVQLPIVLLPGLAEEEQVFHFYVLNNKAKPLKPTELRSTISTSLTNKEIGSLYERLRATGIKAEEAKWTHQLNTDSASPFRGLIDFGLKDSGGFIPENVAFQVVSKFINPGRKYKLLTKDVDNWNVQSDYPMEMFFSFWTAVKAKYQPEWEYAAENKGGQIFYKAGMLVLQDLLLEAMVKGMPARIKKGQKSPLADATDLSEEVDAHLYFLPGDFFSKTWTEKGLDDSDGRAFLKLQMEAAISNQGMNLGNLSLFKAKANK